MDKYNICEVVRERENDYVYGTQHIGKYVETSMYEDLEKIEAYANSRHISGDKDSKGRDKPFFNIVTAAINIWYRATDIDRKHIQIKATRQSHYIISFLATILLQDWMRKYNFGQFLNEWGRALAKYGSCVVKFVEKDGELHREVVPWNRLIVDPIDFDANPKIEKLFYTPAQLRMNEAYDQEVVESLLDSAQSREGLDGQTKDLSSNYIEVYELHGEMPLSYLTGEEDDEKTYVQQMHVVSFTADSKKGKTGKYKDFTLLSGKENKDPYMITHLIKEEGQTLSIGAVRHLFEAQWMVNHSMKTIKDQLDLASKLIYQTADQSFVGKNALTSIDNGDVLIHAANSPLTQVNNNATDIASLSNFMNQWKVLSQEITSTPDALMGNTMPSGTAWRQVEALQQEAHSLFEIMIENKGFYIEEMMRKYVIPNLKRKMDTSEEVVALLDAQGIKKIDSLYIPNEAVRRVNKKILEDALEGDVMTRDQQSIEIETEAQGLRNQLTQMGNQRFIKPSDIEDKTWKEALKDLEWKIEVDVTGEQKSNQAALTTLNTVFATIAGNPAVLENPKVALVFNKILEISAAMSPIELTQFNEPLPSPISAQPQSAIGGSEVEGGLQAVNQ